MFKLEDYVVRVENTCGEEKSVIVTFKYGKKTEIIKKILERAEIKRSLAGIIYELSYQERSFRLFSSGKVIFKNIKEKETVSKVLEELLL